jgi:glycosyltransferase involved in cell wall biosynthesis
MSGADRPLVSIALCTYNGERFLRKQLDSLLAQTHRPLEIVVTDDGSTDATWAILQQYAATSELLRIERNPHNLGYARNFEKALGLCRGQFIALCDQDDIWLPEKIERHLAALGDAALTYSTPGYIDADDQPLPARPFKVRRLSGRCPLALLFHTCVTGHLSLFRREVLAHALPFPPGCGAHDHWIPFVAAAMNGIHASDEVLSLYRVHDANVSIRPRGRGSPLQRWRSRRQRIADRLAKRLAFLRCARLPALLTPQELALLDALIAEQEKLPRSFVSARLRRLLLEHREQLLALYPKAEKMARRLSRGQRWYAAFGYLNRS